MDTLISLELVFFLLKIDWINSHFIASHFIAYKNFGENCEKFPLGPIILPSPGPTFEIVVAAPEKEVIKSNPVKDNNIATKKKIKKYKKIKDIIEDMKRLLIFSLL